MARFSVPEVKRAVKAVRELGLPVHAVNIGQNGEICIDTTPKAPTVPEYGAWKKGNSGGESAA